MEKQGMPDDEKTIFLALGAPKSGTTWLQTILNSHQQVSCRGEGKFSFFGRGLVKLINDYNEFLRSNNEKVFGETFFDPVNQEEYNSVLRAFIETRIKFGVDGSNTHVGSKDPGLGTNIFTISRCFPDAYYIHLVRDPRDVAVSTWHHMNRVEPQLVANFKGIILPSRR